MSYLPIFQTNADKKLEQLEKENAELKAHCERLRGGLDKADIIFRRELGCSTHSPEGDSFHEFWWLEQETPAESLNEIKAQAVEDAFNAFNHNVIDSRNCLSLPQREWLRCYINRLRGK